MSLFSRLGRIVVSIIAGLQISVIPSFAQMQLKIVDILRSPDRYFNQQVKISGKVTNVQSEDNSMSGIYTLVGENNVGLDIISDILPLVGKSYAVTIVVYQGPTPDKPLIREISRKERSKSYIGWIVGGVLCVFAVMLVMQGSGNASGVDTSDYPPWQQ